MKTPVLFIEKNSNYLKFNIDGYDINRNAYNYKGKQPVIAHPPCRLFGRLRYFSTAPACEMFMAYWIISYIRNYGGILEHPRSSTLWKTMKVGTPKNPDHYGGYIISINQSWFGYKAEKKTCLYIVGIKYKELPALPLNFNAIELKVGTRKNYIKRKSRSTTEIPLIEYMLKIINLISLNKS